MKVGAKDPTLGICLLAKRDILLGNLAKSKQKSKWKGEALCRAPTVVDLRSYAEPQGFPTSILSSCFSVRKFNYQKKKKKFDHIRA